MNRAVRIDAWGFQGLVRVTFADRRKRPGTLLALLTMLPVVLWHSRFEPSRLVQQEAAAVRGGLRSIGTADSAVLLIR